MLITTSELAGELGGKDLVIIDSRSFKEYSQGHIPGAVNLDLFAYHWFDTSEKGIEMFESQTRQLLSFAGVQGKKVVFYDDISGMLAARGVWMLLYFSHRNVSMLDGGIKKWVADGLGVETRANGFTPSEFTGKPDRSILAGYEHLRENLDDVVVIDARSKEEYDGTTVRGARRGHIPNAVNVDFNLNIAQDGTIKDQKELAELYAFPKEAQVITYCQGAYRAANSFVALKKLGFKNVRVYLGSWGEWSNRDDLPVC